jgi:transcriptional regulator with XRE-family HTH domain
MGIYSGASMRRRTYPNVTIFLAETGITQAKMAHDLGLSQGYISRLRRGLQQPPLDLALRISRYARVPIESLVRGPLREYAHSDR